MSAKIFALLVGIDSYQSPVSPLQGCVADIEIMHSFLESGIGDADHQLDAIVLKNEQATREAILENTCHG